MHDSGGEIAFRLGIYYASMLFLASARAGGTPAVETEQTQYVGKVLRQQAEQIGLRTDELKIEWPLPSELMSKWQDDLSQYVRQQPLDWYRAGDQVNDAQIADAKTKFKIPPSEQYLIGGAVGFSAFAVTDEALYFMTVERDGHAWGRPSRISHRTIVASDSLSEIQLLRAPEYELQSVLIGCAKRDLTWELQAFRERHLADLNQEDRQSERPATPSFSQSQATGTLNAYLGILWGSSFAEVNRRLAGKAGANYKERRISEAEWNRISADGISRTEQEKARSDERAFIGKSIGKDLLQWGLPARGPYASFSFDDETGRTECLFNADRFYAVKRTLNGDWLRQHGMEVLKAMCAKYGEAILRQRDYAVADQHPLELTWADQSGFIHATLQRFQYNRSPNLHSLSDDRVRILIPPVPLLCRIKEVDVGYGPNRLDTSTAVRLKQQANANKSKVMEGVRLPHTPANPANGKYLIVVLHDEWYLPVGLQNQDAQRYSNNVTSFISSNTTVVDRKGNKFKPIFSFGERNLGLGLFFDVPANTEDVALEIDASELVEDSHGRESERKGPQFIDLEQTALPWGLPDRIKPDEITQYEISPTGEITYGSKPICLEIAEANKADESKKGQRQTQGEKDQQKKLGEKF